LAASARAGRRSFMPARLSGNEGFVKLLEYP
jgi:hypothetical protein